MLSDHKFQFLKAELFEVVNMMELSPIDIYLKMTQQELFYCHEIFFERNHALDNTSNKPSIDLIRIKISLSYTSICAPQQWFIGENTHEIKISKQLFHSVTRLAALPALLLVSPAGLSTLHPHPQPSLALAAWPKGQGRFSSAQLNAPCDKKKKMQHGRGWEVLTWQGRREILISSYSFLQKSKFCDTNFDFCGSWEKKKNHIIEDCEVSVASFCLNCDPQSL